MHRQSSRDQTKINLQVIENRGAVDGSQLRKVIQKCAERSARFPQRLKPLPGRPGTARLKAAPFPKPSRDDGRMNFKRQVGFQ
jgi:hypothetical protein